MLNIPSQKLNQQSLVVSHLCGSRNCCTESHMIIETKCINDERVHCHFVAKKLCEVRGARKAKKRLRNN